MVSKCQKNWETYHFHVNYANYVNYAVSTEKIQEEYVNSRKLTKKLINFIIEQ